MFERHYLPHCRHFAGTMSTHTIDGAITHFTGKLKKLDNRLQHPISRIFAASAFAATTVAAAGVEFALKAQTLTGGTPLPHDPAIAGGVFGGLTLLVSALGLTTEYWPRLNKRVDNLSHAIERLTTLQKAKRENRWYNPNHVIENPDFKARRWKKFQDATAENRSAPIQPHREQHARVIKAAAPMASTVLELTPETALSPVVLEEAMLPAMTATVAPEVERETQTLIAPAVPAPVAAEKNAELAAKSNVVVLQPRVRPQSPHKSHAGTTLVLTIGGVGLGLLAISLLSKSTAKPAIAKLASAKPEIARANRPVKREPVLLHKRAA